MDHISTILQILTLLAIILGFSDRIFKKAKEESNIIDRVETLESNQKETSKDIKIIKENHLTHIQDDINKININLAEINTTLKIKLRE